MTMPAPTSDETLETILGYKDQDVKGIYFNCDDAGFYVPLDKLKPILKNLRENPPE